MEQTLETIQSTLCSAAFRHWLEEPIIHFGSDPDMRFSRQRLITEVGCGNFIAAARLDRVLKRMGYPTVRKIHEMSPADFARIPGVGETQLYLLTCILHDADVDVFAWWRWREDDQRKERDAKFSTHKYRVIHTAKRRDRKRGK